MAEREKQDGAEPQEQERTDRSRIVEQDPKDIPQKAQSQVPDVNVGKVQPGHRDREQI